MRGGVSSRGWERNAQGPGLRPESAGGCAGGGAQTGRGEPDGGGLCR